MNKQRLLLKALFIMAHRLVWAFWNPLRVSPSATKRLSSTAMSKVTGSIRSALEPLIQNDRPIVAVLSVSGGSDSMALLHACMQFYPLETYIRSQYEHLHPLNIQWHVVHFHHRQRREADGDCALVQDASKEYGVPCHVYDWNDQPSKASFSQATARDWRRSCLLDYTHQLQTKEGKQQQNPPVGVIMTAHHEEDSMESILAKWIRGVHISNLSGIPSHTELKDNLWLVRPFLDCQKQDLIHFLGEREWREDASNKSPKYLRNRIRNELVPLLTDLMSSEDVLQQRLKHMVDQSEQVRQDLLARLDPLLKSIVDDSGRLQWESHLQSQSTLLQQQVLHEWILRQVQQADFSVSYGTLQRIWLQLQQPNLEWVLQIGQGWNLQRQGSVLRITGSERDPQTASVPWTWSIASAHHTSSEKDCLHLFIPQSALGGDLTFVATTLAGGEGSLPRFFTPKWKDSSVKLRSFLRGQKVPLEDRETTPILYCPKLESVVAVQVHSTWNVCRQCSEEGPEKIRLWVEPATPT